MGDVAAFVALSAEQYGAKVGGNKGNLTITTYDGRYKVQRQVSETLVFDERLQAAKALIDECITEWTEGSRDEIRALINDAFQVDKEGRINTGRVLSLRRLKIDDERWRQAMLAKAVIAVLLAALAFGGGYRTGYGRADATRRAEVAELTARLETWKAEQAQALAAAERTAREQAEAATARANSLAATLDKTKAAQAAKIRDITRRIPHAPG